MFKNFSLRNKMLVLLLIPVSLGFVILSYMSYYSAYEAMDRQIRSTLSLLTANAADELAMWTREKEVLVTNQALILGQRQYSEAEVKNLLVATKNSSSGVSNVILGLENGKILDALGTSYPVDMDSRKLDWYKKAVSTKEVAYSDVYESASGKKPTVTVTKTIMAGDRVFGVVGIELDLEIVKAIVAKVKSGETGYAFALDNQGNYLQHPTLKITDNILTIQNGIFKDAGNSYMSGQAAVKLLNFNGVQRYNSSTPVGKTGWSIVVSVPEAELVKDITAMAKRTAVFCIIGIVLFMLIIYFIANSIARPIKKMALAAEAIANGDLQSSSQGLTGLANDEIGKLATSFHTMTVNLQQVIKQVAQSAEQVAASSEELTASAEQSAQATTQVAATISEVAQGAEKQVKAIDDTSAVVEQLSAGIQQVAANTNKVSSMADKTTSAANQGGKAVDAAMSQMISIENSVTSSAQVVTKLGDRSKEIGQIVDTISGIAGQTNLLALNAAIEAARAGEQGRGFAVVAEEVRKLAEQSQEAAKQIAGLISEIQMETDSAVVAMNDGTREVKVGSEVVNTAGQAFKEIVTLISEVSSQIKEISAAIQQMASGSQQIVVSVREIDRISKDAAGQTQTVSAATEEQSASMEEIAASSQALARMAEELQSAVRKFRM